MGLCCLAFWVVGQDVERERQGKESGGLDDRDAAFEGERATAGECAIGFVIGWASRGLCDAGSAFLCTSGLCRAGSACAIGVFTRLTGRASSFGAAVGGYDADEALATGAEESLATIAVAFAADGCAATLSCGCVACAVCEGSGGFAALIVAAGGDGLDAACAALRARGAVGCRFDGALVVATGGGELCTSASAHGASAVDGFGVGDALSECGIADVSGFVASTAA